MCLCKIIHSDYILITKFFIEVNSCMQEVFMLLVLSKDLNYTIIYYMHKASKDTLYHALNAYMS